MKTKSKLYMPCSIVEGNEIFRIETQIGFIRVSKTVFTKKSLKKRLGIISIKDKPRKKKKV